MRRQLFYTMTNTAVRVESGKDGKRRLGVFAENKVATFDNPSDLILFINELKDIVDDWDQEILQKQEEQQ